MESDGDIEVEMLDSTQISANELGQFEPTEPLQVVEILPDSPAKKHNPELNPEMEESLIRKYITGESEFPDYYTKFDDEADDDDETDVEKEDLARNRKDMPSTSAAAADDYDMPQQKNRRPTVRKRSTLNAVLQGLMGEANLCFVRGKIEMAEKICLEIIRQNPLAPEPFFTLAEINEAKDAEKYLNFLTIAAHLDPSNCDQWLRIVQIQIEKGDLQQARIYLSKAIRYIPKDFDLRHQKAKLLERMNEHFLAMLTYLKMIPLVPPDRAELCLVTAKNVAKYFYTAKKVNYALEAMNGAYASVARLFSIEDINLYLELLLASKKYEQVLTVLKEQMNVEVDFGIKDNQVHVVSCIIPIQLVSDLRAKLCVSLIHLKAFHLLNYMIENVHAFIPVTDGVDWYVDIAEALMAEEKYQETLRLLEPIIQTLNETPAYVWLRVAECHRSLGNIEEAIESYYSVVNLAPFCYDAKFTLSALLKQQGRNLEAIKALEQDMDGEAMNPRMLYERCLMLKTVGEIEQYIDIGYILLSRSSIKFRSREELLATAYGGAFFHTGVKTIIQSRQIVQNGQTETQSSQKEQTDLTVDEELALFTDLLATTHQLGKFGTSQKLCFAVVTAKRFLYKMPDLDKVMVLCNYFNDDIVLAFNYFREMINRKPKQTILWNFLSVLIQKGDNLIFHRFMRRFLDRSAVSIYMNIFLGNYHLYCNSLKYALNFYVPILREKEDPLICLLIATVFNQLALQKKILTKPPAVTQAIAFANKYSKLRMSPATRQEIFYNLGRIHHQSGIMYMALDYYQKALEATDELIDQNAEILSLQQEIAFNIHLIYKASGNVNMARKYLYKYIVV